MTDAPTPKPCKCGGAPLPVRNATGRRMGHALICGDCYRATPFCRTAGIAATLWNKQLPKEGSK